MAEALVVVSAVDSVLAWVEKLSNLLKAITNIEEKMEKLKELSPIIDKVIEDVESRPFIDDAVKDLLKKLNNLARDLEDVVDDYDTKVLQKQQRSIAFLGQVRDFFSSDNQLRFNSKVGVRIKEITENLDSILRRKSILLNLPQSSTRMSEPSLHREILSCNSFVVIGREPEKNMIVNMLTNDDDGESSHNTLKVIAIVGMGGLGKTTLAQLVFNDARVKDHFESSRMWKVVGAEFDPTKIMKSVLELATGASVNISEIDLVRQKLEKALSGKRFLLVLDDVWNEDPLMWGILKAALTCGARGSKVLVTTRSQQVSKIMNSSNTTHQIQELSGNDCLSLFQKFAFGDEAVDQKLMEIGEKIIEKCGGVPLAAISLGSMLSSTREETYWSSVLKSEIWQLRNEEEKVLAVLKLSYDTLPPRSKKCFAFASLFSKNDRMEKDELIKLWMANGFVCSEGNFDAETNGNHVFDYLVLRSFFLLAPSRGYSHETQYTMHDLMHDLARSVSADAYWNSNQDSVKDIGKRTYHLQIDERKLPDMTQVLGKKPSNLRTFMFKDKLSGSRINLQLEGILSELKLLRVLYLTDQSGISEIPESIGNLIHLRYLNLDYNIINVLPTSIGNLIQLRYLNLHHNDIKVLPTSIGNLIDLRYLNLHRNIIEALPTSIGNLIHLRYLNLSQNKIEVLPDSITLLSNLQYLNLSFNYRLRELPKELGNMQNLRDLALQSDSTLTHMPCGLSRLTNLRSLPLFIASGKTGACSITELEDLKLQGEMTIKFSDDFKNYSCSGRKILKNKDLNELFIEFNGSGRYDKGMLDDLCPNRSLKKLTIWNYWSRQFPTWLMESQLPNLVEVNLQNCLYCEHIPPFGNLQFLKKLGLCFMNGITQMIAEFHGYGGFSSLQELDLGKMDNLEEWSEFHVADQLFPLLQKLRIFDCPKLKSMPRLIPTIKHLEISGCSGSLLSCIGSLTSLSVLKLEEMHDMTSFPSGCIRNLTSLKELEITECRQLQSLPGDEMQHLKLLRLLTIKGCPSIILQPEELVQILNSVPKIQIQICGKKVNLRGQLQYLHRLEELILNGAHDDEYRWHGFSKLIICCCHELESLMTAEQASITVLEQLYIDGIPNLTTLPDWLQHLKSLHLLSVENCPLLGMLPRGLKNLHMLENLIIVGCPQLESRCKRGTGEDWPIISHVQNVDIHSWDSAGEEAEDEESVDEDGAEDS